MIFKSDIEEIKELPNFSIIRATETWQQAGACYVQIQTMAKKHHIPRQGIGKNGNTNRLAGLW